MGIEGIVYDNKGVEYSSFKIFESQFIPKFKWSFCNFVSNNAWKDYDHRFMGIIHLFGASVFLNGTLYWVVSSSEYLDKMFIISLDCSTERSRVFCCLPCKRKSSTNAPVLAVFRGDRFSLLEECNETKKIEIWVTKNKINNGDPESVDWIIFMTVSISNFPDLVGIRSYSPPSYFIEYKTLVMCSCDENGQAWIYVVRGNKLSKSRIEVGPWPLHITYIPSLVPVPQAATYKSLISLSYYIHQTHINTKSSSHFLWLRRSFFRPLHNQQKKMMSFVANLVIKSLDRASAVYVEEVVDSSRAAYVENGGDDDDSGYDYAPAA
ncbi:F-box associated interaction domain [Arabidopsis thaliana x Arabidopsis arenosa]|uniref:F-box associated interaction domain n=1 Tax=Arabidopsis thaliana x Arabidopsis arenosa TaxID=1240361 RepID=A0A8T2C457_9BRAS|nr:F-box associated interaction domain [Arabidopsis thaliana x Arabidopsis arenosa]